MPSTVWVGTDREGLNKRNTRMCYHFNVVFCYLNKICMNISNNSMFNYQRSAQILLVLGNLYNIINYSHINYSDIVVQFIINNDGYSIETAPQILLILNCSRYRDEIITKFTSYSLIFLTAFFILNILN